VNGKTIQFNRSVSNTPNWNDVIVSNFTYEPGCYRIKPEPQFSIGDWVVSPTGKINQLIADDMPKRLETKGFSLWQPTLNEYCWFWDCDYNSTPILSQFAYIEEDINSTNQFVTISNSMYFNCEPCLALPTVLNKSCKQ